MAPRTKFLLILSFFAAPMLIAWLAYFGWHPDKHKNYGSLLKVTPLVHTQGALVDGTPLQLDTLKGKWLMVYVGGANCDAACQKQLYYMRQSRLVLGKDQNRVARLWVLSDSATPDAALLQAHTGLYVWRPARPDFVQQFPRTKADAKHLYVVDPLGNLMLRFPENVEPKGMIKDLKLLLKASQIG